LIGKISTSQSFDGLFRYLLKPEKQAYIVGGNVISTNASDLSQEFKEPSGNSRPVQGTG
jgi:hypothetical protein